MYKLLWDTTPILIHVCEWICPLYMNVYIEHAEYEDRRAISACVCGGVSSGSGGSFIERHFCFQSVGPPKRIALAVPRGGPRTVPCRCECDCGSVVSFQNETPRRPLERPTGQTELSPICFFAFSRRCLQEKSPDCVSPRRYFFS